MQKEIGKFKKKKEGTQLKKLKPTPCASRPVPYCTRALLHPCLRPIAPAPVPAPYCTCACAYALLSPRPAALEPALPEACTRKKKKKRAFGPYFFPVETSSLWRG
ncbi:hypothetical protein SLEP1_g28764 [Rubroshorea leprosula]|uniref:Uncharacterized protein n=1 Tax=Rubroshorea leprosula TaxID=152421 RepID=A0AAV5JUP0_9ROSI|nr:hypothetical protein SLEP1_g28764 [Rubroshorea leprosula]